MTVAAEMTVKAAHDNVPLPGLNALPLLLAATWWNEMLHFWCEVSLLPVHAAAIRPFTVPDCIARNGEHALFA